MQETGYEQLKLENQLCFPLYACARRVISLYTPYLKPLGLSYTQYLVFLVLWEEDGRTVGEISRKLYLDSGTLTPLLKKLEKDGRVLRKRDETDERVTRIYLTEEGRALREEAKTIPLSVGSCIRLKPEEAGGLYSLLYLTMERTGD